jgi:hypothetical protein
MEPHHVLTSNSPADVYDDRNRGYRLLSRRQRNTVRDVARSAWLRHPDDAEAAKAEAEQALGSIFVTILLGVAIRLAIELIMYWILNREREPQAVYCPGEPGYEGDSEIESKNTRDSANGI